MRERAPVLMRRPGAAVVWRPLVWSPAITSFRAIIHRTDAHPSRLGAVDGAMPDGGDDGPAAERDVLAYEALRHVAAFSVVCAPAALGSGLLDGLLPVPTLPVRLVAALLAALACAILGGWPAELIGRNRRLVQFRLALFTLAILLLALHATTAIEAGRGAGPGAGLDAGAGFLVMMAAAIPLAPWPPAAIPFAAVAGYGAFRTLAAPGVVLWLLPAAIVVILVMGSRFRGRILLSVRLRNQRERLETLLVDYEHGSSELRWTAGADGMLRMEVTQPTSHLAHSPLAAGSSGSPLAVNWAEFVRDGCRLETPARADFLVLREAVRREQPFRDCILPIPVGGEEHWWAFSGRPVLAPSGRVCGYRGIASDMTEQRAAERRIRYLAAHDGLTGLGNRAAFLGTLGAMLSDRTALELILVNIDGFQLVNDTHGAEIGDALLAGVAERLRRLAGQRAALARLGGDEFGIVLPRGGGTDDAAGATLARRLPAALAEPFRVAGLELHIGASLGVAASPAHGSEGTALFKAASLALARAKALGGSIAVRYDRGLEAAQSERKALQLDLRSAMARREFELEYQPIVELATGRIIACEALLRWNHPQRGRVSPALFIEIAEQIGLIAALGAWVVHTAVRDAAMWPIDVSVTVNVSPLQFRSPLLVEAVTQALETTGFRPARLMLEVTESTVLDASADTTAVLTSLRQAGVCLALDDFGTGYASLAYLDRFQFDALKVDRSFLQNSHRPATGAILEAVARLGADLGMRTVAEGVETEVQRARLVGLGYNCAQGFLFARSMPAGAILAMLAPAAAPQRALGVTPAAV